MAARLLVHILEIKRIVIRRPFRGLPGGGALMRLAAAFC